MLALSLKGKDQGLPHLEFFCPRCFDRRQYEVKPVSKDIPLFVIPLFEMQKLIELVECQVCKNGFDPNILKPSNQSLFKLVGTTRDELLHRSSPGALKLRLMSDGLNEVVVNKLISLAQY
jgi:hypothetical protein